MKKQQLRFHFHNPNTMAEAADYILKALVEANIPKLERGLREAADTYIEQTEIIQAENQRQSLSLSM